MNSAKSLTSGSGQRSGRDRFRRRLRRLRSRFYRLPTRMRNGRRTRPGPPARIDRKRHWRGSSPLKRSVRIFVYGGVLLLLALLAWAGYAVLTRRPVALDNRCDQRALSCGAITSFLVPILTLALVTAFFLLGRLWYLRRRYLHTARARPQDMVPTAGSIIGDVVGRDELCRVMIADVRDTSTRRPHVVVGGIGTGKTALLVRLTQLLAKQHAVPVAVRLRDAQDKLDFGELARKKFLSDQQSSLLSDTEGEKVWRQLLKESRVVVLADGLEEALIGKNARDERDTVIRLAIHQANRDKLPLIIASRPHDPLRGTEAALVELEPLSEEAALDYIQSGDPVDDESRIDWIVETADVTEAPLYLQIARQLYQVGLLTHPPANRADLEQLDTRGVDRSGLRLGLLETWEKALVNGYLSPGVALSSNDRVATIEQLSVLACIGLRQDLLQVKLGDFSTLWESCGADKQPPPIVREARKRLSQSGHDFLDVKLAATWGTQLQLVEAQGSAVRFPHSMLQAYLGSRLIAYAMADAGFRKNALDNAGRELLIALALHSRASAKPDSGAAAKPDSKAVAKQARPRRLARAAVRSGSSPDKPIDLRTLCAAAHEHTNSKALDLYAAALEIDSVEPAPQHSAIADEIVRDWNKPVEQDPRTLEHAKLNLVRRFGEAARAISARRSQDGIAAEPAYCQLFEIGCAEQSYPVRLAVAQEIGAGGDDTLAQLAGSLRPDPARWRQALAETNSEEHVVGQQSGGEAGSTGTGLDQQDAEERERRAARQEIMRAWLVPLLVGSATSDKWRACARDLLQSWLDFVHTQHRQTGRERFGLSFEIALAQGFKHAANRRRDHPHAPEKARTYLAEQTQEMLAECDFWFTRLTLLHAMTLWHLPDGADQRPNREPNPDYKALVAHWCGMEDRRRRDRHTEHPFVEEAGRLAVRALETGRPERYIWIDESGIVSTIGSSPARPGRRRKHNLWIPRSTGWTALNARAQQLVADVLLLLNLAERGESRVRDRDLRLRRTNKNYLPPCIAEDRSPLKPNRPLDVAGEAAPGSSCAAECQFGLCPYPLKGAQPHRQELTEAFCRRQQRLLAPGSLRSSAAPWQEISSRRLRRFWKELGEPVPRAELEDDELGQTRHRDRHL
jgi:NACHT domain